MGFRGLSAVRSTPTKPPAEENSDAEICGSPRFAGRCMEGVDDPFSDEGEHIVYMRFYAAAQIALTDILPG